MWFFGKLIELTTNRKNSSKNSRKGFGGLGRSHWQQKISLITIEDEINLVNNFKK